jgi:hypothetical protein
MLHASPPALCAAQAQTNARRARRALCCSASVVTDGQEASDTRSSAERYSQRGVSASKEDVHAAIAALDKGLYPGAFCKARLA